MSRNWKNGGRYRENKYKRSMSMTSNYVRRTFLKGIHFRKGHFEYLKRQYLIDPETQKLCKEDFVQCSTLEDYIF